MPEKTVSDALIADLGRHVGRSVRLRGWLYNRRSSGSIQFLIIRDGTGLCQGVIEKGPQTESFWDEAERLPKESSLEATGSVRAEPRSVGGYELAISGLRVVHRAEEFPITNKPHGIEFLMRHRHLWFRSRRQHAILRIRSTLIDAIRSYFNDHGYTLIDTPILSCAAGEDTQTLFAVDYFGDQVYLAQTGQLHVEAACMALGKVYCFGPTFRAEKSKTRRHLAEFWMVEPEVAFCDLDCIIEIAEDFIRSIVARVLADHRSELELLERNVDELEAVARPFARITYTEAAELLRSDETHTRLQRELDAKKTQAEESAGTIAEMQAKLDAGKLKKWQAEKLAQDVQAARERHADLVEEIANIPHHMELAREFAWGKDLGGSDETIISNSFDRPVFVTHYPKQAKAFYMYVDRSDARVVCNFDLLAPQGFGEIIGGSQREDDYDTLHQRIIEMGLDPKDYEWYLDLRRYGSVPHAGFGLGIERTLAWICGLTHIRETIPFPRMMGKITL